MDVEGYVPREITLDTSVAKVMLRKSFAIARQARLVKEVRAHDQARRENSEARSAAAVRFPLPFLTPSFAWLGV